MIHFALGVAAFLFICWLVLAGIGVVARAFEEGGGCCGCITLVAVVLFALFLLAMFA